MNWADSMGDLFRNTHLTFTFCGTSCVAIFMRQTAMGSLHTNFQWTLMVHWKLKKGRSWTEWRFSWAIHPLPLHSSLQVPWEPQNGGRTSQRLWSDWPQWMSLGGAGFITPRYMGTHNRAMLCHVPTLLTPNLRTDHTSTSSSSFTKEREIKTREHQES